MKNVLLLFKPLLVFSTSLIRRDGFIYLSFDIFIMNLFSRLCDVILVFIFFLTFFVFVIPLTRLFFFIFVILYQICTVFEEHGTIVEIVLLKHKKTGTRQGICVNYYLYFTYLYHPQFVQFGLPRVMRSNEFHLILAHVDVICCISYLQVLTIVQILFNLHRKLFCKICNIWWSW